MASTIVGDDVVIFTASVLASRWPKISPVVAEMMVSRSQRRGEVESERVFLVAAIDVDIETRVFSLRRARYNTTIFDFFDFARCSVQQPPGGREARRLPSLNSEWAGLSPPPVPPPSGRKTEENI